MRSKCSPVTSRKKHKDFGQGFYLTSSKEQARNFIQASIKKAVLRERVKNQKYGFISKYKFKFNDELNIFIYPEADADWLHCVVGHRRTDTFPKIVREMKKYDIIAGKIANDNTNATIAAYMALTYGEIGTKRADDICISLLLPEKLQDQFCFKTNEALKSLSFVESEQIWL